MPTISLCITSNNPNLILLDKAINSAVGFDEIILHINNMPINTDINNLSACWKNKVKVIWHPDNLTAGEGFNFCINAATSDWICCFCDDDFFHEEHLHNLLSWFHNTNIEADIVQFPCYVGNDKIDWRVWGDKPVTYNGIRQGNMVPFSSFYRKTLWERVGGYENILFNDFHYWLKCFKIGATYTLWDKPIYYFRQAVETRLSDKERSLQPIEITLKQLIDKVQ